MNYSIKNIMLYVCMLIQLSLHGMPIDIPGSGNIRIVTNESAARQKIHDNLKNESVALESKFKESSEGLQKRIQDLKNDIDGVKKNETSENAIKKIALLNKLVQLLQDIRETRKQILEVIKAHIDFWDKYFAQGNKTNEYSEQNKSVYTFTDLQKITKDIIVQEEARLELSQKRDNNDLNLHRQESIVTAKDRDIRAIEKEVDSSKKQSSDGRDFKKEILLFDLEKEIAHKERDLAELRIELYQKEIDLYDSKLLINQETIKAYKEHMLFIRSHIHIDKQELGMYEQKAADIKRESSAQKNKLIEQRNKILQEKNAYKEKLDALVQKHTLSLSEKPFQQEVVKEHSMQEVFVLYSAHLEQIKIMLADQLLEKIKVELAIQDAKSEQVQLLYDTVRLLYGVTQDLFSNTDYLDKERQIFKDMKQAIHSDIKKDNSEITLAHNAIKDQYKTIALIKKEHDQLKRLLQKTADSAQHKKIEDNFALLSTIHQKLELQKDTLLHISELYTKLSDIKEETLEHINFMLQELDLVGVWHRAINAMTWDGIKNIIPNLKIFIRSIITMLIAYVQHFSVYNYIDSLSSMSFGDMLVLCSLLFIILLFFIVLKSWMPRIYKKIMLLDNENHSMYIVNRYIALVLSSLIIVFNQLYFWIIFLLFSVMYKLSIAIMVLFYLYSIFLWIYILRIFLQQFITINRRSDYILLQKRFIQRFYGIANFFGISTVVILFLRKMFILVMTYQQYEFPNILLRLYHVVIFISAALLLDKDEVLHYIPVKNRIGQFVFYIVQKYYYVVLAIVFGLLIMGDPYLGGYGSLIWHVVWTSLFTIGISIGLFFIHKYVGRYSKFLFFTYDEHSDSVSDNFEHAKTWYGLYVVTLFVSFVVICALIIASLWGYNFSLHSLKEALYYQLPLQIESWDKKLISLQVIDIIRIIMIIVLGFLSAYVFRRFILDKIFEIHYVDAGVQNTVAIISRYIIIFVAVLIAFAQAGLGNVVTYILGFGTFALAWAFKDLFTDFFAYFFILVQRPLKLGDFVKVDENVLGVVRKIGPRTVILRRKNAVNIVVPNSLVLKSSLYNWNYTRSYIGFDDICFSVPFGTDVIIVRDVLYKILDDNPDVLKMPQPIVRLDDFSDKGYRFMVRGFLSAGDTLRQWDIASNVRFAIVLKLAEHGIQVAAPTVNVIWKNNEKLSSLNRYEGNDL